MRVRKTKINIKVKTGLHIGGSDSMMRIGGVDSEVIKRDVYCDDDGNVVLGGKYKISEPYIPGSSLKGKLRSLLENYYEYHEVVKEIIKDNDNEVLGKLKNDKETKEKYKNLLKNFPESIKGEVLNNIRLDFVIDYLAKKDLLKDSSGKKKFKKFNEKTLRNIIKLFGSTDDNGEIGVTRLIIEDSYISEKIREKYVNKEIELFEEKMENTIDRYTGKVKKGGVRNIERVVPGVEFESELILRVFEGDDDKEFERLIKLGFELLKRDYLGGSGSRGYGRVEVDEVEFEEESFNLGSENEVVKT